MNPFMFDNIKSNVAFAKDAQNQAVFKKETLRNSKALLIGAGGIGSPAALYLAGMGIGRLDVCDGDTVEVSNLNRQIIYNVGDIGKMKAEAAVNRLIKFAPDCEFHSIGRFITDENADEIIDGYDIVLLCPDNNKTRLVANKSCVKKKIPAISCGVEMTVGKVYLYVPDKSPCISCILDPTESKVKNTVSAAAGIVAGFAVLRAASALCGYTDKAGIMTLIDMKKQIFDNLPMKIKADCPVCGGINNVR
ncbi:MAG: HesA/MoeB/ThiF family protein [Clostridiales bacterium]|nr:HesA/MoeB/ThiF family protein [Clostridiales bacterium]